MRKTTLIGLVTLIVVSIGVSSAYAITITLAGDVAVSENLAVVGTITGPTIDGINATIASGSAVCPGQNVEHWDKIIFHPTVPVVDFGVPSGNPSELLPQSIQGDTTMYDIKVLDDPTKVADTSQKVADFLNNLNYGIIGGSAGDIHHHDIHVTSVQYSIICTGP